MATASNPTATTQETPGLDLNPGGHEDEADDHTMNDHNQLQNMDGNDATYNDNLQNDSREQDQQDQLFGTGIKEDG